MNSKDIFDIIISQLSTMNIPASVDLAADNIGEVSFQELGIDSLEITEFSIFLEETIGVIIETEDFPMNATINELAEHITQLKSCH